MCPPRGAARRHTLAFRGAPGWQQGAAGAQRWGEEGVTTLPVTSAAWGTPWAGGVGGEGGPWCSPEPPGDTRSRPKPRWGQRRAWPRGVKVPKRSPTGTGLPQKARGGQEQSHPSPLAGSWPPGGCGKQGGGRLKRGRAPLLPPLLLLLPGGWLRAGGWEGG